MNIRAKATNPGFVARNGEDKRVVDCRFHPGKLPVYVAIFVELALLLIF